MSDRSIQSISDVPLTPMRPGFKVRHLAGAIAASAFDPFLQADVFEMSQPIFPPHPHAGFSAITYILPESPTGFRNRDSLGHDLTIAPGSLHWTSAGSGVHHEEVPLEPGKPAIGLQIFVNLPIARKREPARMLHLATSDVPVVVTEGVTIRVLAGMSNGAVSPLDPPTPVRLLDVSLAPGATFTQSLEEGENAVILLLDGHVDIGDKTLRAGQVADTDTASSRLLVTAGSSGVRLILFAGMPLREPVVASGPFIAESQAAMATVIENYHAGRMGRLSPVS